VPLSALSSPSYSRLLHCCASRDLTGVVVLLFVVVVFVLLVVVVVVVVTTLVLHS